VSQQLIEFAEHEFRLDLTFIETASLREHLKVAKAEEDLKNPNPFPEALEEQWRWFTELSCTGRSVSPSGSPSAISSQEIVAWCQLNQITLQPWEVKLIRLLDMAWLSAARKSS
jgi:hypothetical protein